MRAKGKAGFIFPSTGGATKYTVPRLYDVQVFRREGRLPAMLKQLAFFFGKLIHSATAAGHCIIMHIPPKEGDKEKVKILVLLSNFQHGVTAAYGAHELVDCAQNFLTK